MKKHWQTLDTESLLRQRDEATTAANAGSYPVPLGQPLRRSFPVSAPEPKGHLDDLASSDPEYARALRSMGWIK